MADRYDRREQSYVDFCVSQAGARSAALRRATGEIESTSGCNVHARTESNSADTPATQGGDGA